MKKTSFLIAVNGAFLFIIIVILSSKVAQLKYKKTILHYSQTIELANTYILNQVRFQSDFTRIPLTQYSQISDGTDTLALKDILFDPHLLVIHISTRDCQSCSIGILENFLHRLQGKIDPSKVIILSSFPSLRDYYLFKSSIKSGYRAFQLLYFNYELSNWSFCFFTDVNSAYSSPLLINMNYPNLIDEYLSSLFSQLPTNHKQ